MIKIETKSNIGKRFLAGIVDYLIICIVGIILIYTLGTPDIEGGYELNGLPAKPISYMFLDQSEPPLSGCSLFPVDL